MELIAIKNIRIILEKIPTYRKKVTPKMDVTQFQTTLYLDILRLDYNTMELNYILDVQYLETNVRICLGQVESLVKGLKASVLNAKEHQDFINIIEVLTLLKDTFDANLADELNYYSLKTVVDKKEYLTEYTYDATLVTREEVTFLGGQLMHQNNGRMINVFDPSCKEGDLLNDLKDANRDKIIAHGLNIRHYQKSDKASTKVDKVIKGGGKSSNITNDCFDVLMLNADVLYTVRNDNNTLIPLVSPEKDQVKDYYKYLRQDGLMFLYLPIYRLDSGMALILSKFFKDIQIYRANNRTSGPRYDLYQILIIARKSYTPDRKMDEYTKMMNLKIENMPSVFTCTSASGDYLNLKLPSEALEVRSFKGSVFEASDIQKVLDTSGLYDALFEEINYVKNTRDKSPLLPFNIGQIGLVLTSGELDGLVKGPDGVSHVIKGRVVKKTETEEKVSSDKKTVEEKKTHLNQVQINIITADGVFKQLS